MKRILSLLTLIAVSTLGTAASAQHVYYAHHPPAAGGGLTLIASTDGTEFRVTDLDLGVELESGSLDRFDVHAVELDGGHHYRLDASPAIQAYHGDSTTGFAGSHGTANSTSPVIGSATCGCSQTVVPYFWRSSGRASEWS